VRGRRGRGDELVEKMLMEKTRLERLSFSLHVEGDAACKEAVDRQALFPSDNIQHFSNSYRRQRVIFFFGFIS
jgi:hypothetical protein